MDVTNSTKFKHPLLSLSNVENINLETFSTVSAGNKKLNISSTFSFSSLPLKKEVLEIVNFDDVIIHNFVKRLICIVRSLVGVVTEN